MAKDDYTISRKEWADFFTKCRRKRLEPKALVAMVHMKRDLCPLNGAGIFRSFFQDQNLFQTPLDPLLQRSVRALLQRGIAKPYEVLDALYEHRHLDLPSQQDILPFQLIKPTLFRLELQSSIFEVLGIYISQDAVTDDEIAPEFLLKSLTKWMSALNMHNSEAMVFSATLRFADIMQEVSLIRHKLATLLGALIQKSLLDEVEILQEKLPPGKTATIPCTTLTLPRASTIPTEHHSVPSTAGFAVSQIKATCLPWQYKLTSSVLRADLRDSLSSFLPMLSISSSEDANRIGSFQIQKLYALLQSDVSTDFRESGDDPLGLGSIQANSVGDNDPINTRGGLVVLLDGILTGRSSASDPLMLAFLQSRYRDNVSFAITEFITASLDLLAISMVHEDSGRRSFTIRSFVVNKVPLVLEAVSATAFQPVNYELSISQALDQFDASLSADFSNTLSLQQKNVVLLEVREELLLSFSLHGQLQEDGFKRLGGKTALPSSNKGTSAKRHRQTLFNEYKNNPQKVAKIMRGVESMDGNAIVHVEVITDILSSHCSTRDTLSLKNLCDELLARPQCLDVIATFSDLFATILPLCRLLNDWKIEEDQGEHQPVYDEFGSVFLLLVTIAKRYELDSQDLGLEDDTSFLYSVLQVGPAARNINKLSSQQSEQFTRWIRDLFETHGIRDETMSSCPPQDFYLLVPSLFQQVIVAFSRGVLDGEALKSGIELLLEAFLVPSLILGIEWLAGYSLHPGADKKATLNVLQKIILPGSLRGDSAARHKTVLSLLSPTILSVMSKVNAQEFKNQQVQPFVDQLKAQAEHSMRTEVWSQKNDSSNSNMPSQDLLSRLRDRLNSLCYWSAPAAMGTSLPTYSYGFLCLVVRRCGAHAALDAIVEEVKSQTSMGFGEIALEIATVILYTTYLKDRSLATSAENNVTACRNRHGISLHDCLQIAVQEAPKVILKETLKAETYIRLHRRLEALATIAPAAAPGLDMHTGDIVGNLDLGSATNLGGEQPEDLAFSNADTNLQLNIDAALAQDNHEQATEGSAIPTTEDDIFGDLQLDMNFDF